jgi:hypothetical protein
MERTVEFLLNPLRGRRVWAVMLPEGELMYDIMSVRRAEFCMAENERYWMNPFGGAFLWTTKVSKPYEAELVMFKKEAQQYMCVFDLEIADLQYIDCSPLKGDLIFDEVELSRKLGERELAEFKRFMSELWEYVKGIG